MVEKRDRLAVKSADVEHVPRKSFTPGWDNFLSHTERLPVKTGGKIVRITAPVAEQNSQNESNYDSASISESSDGDDNGDEDILSNDIDRSDNDGKQKKSEKGKTTTVPQLTFRPKSAAEVDALRQRIAVVCNSIVVDPQRSLKKKIDPEEDEEEAIRMVDLFQFLSSTDAQEFEMAMLSALLVFKDIVPGYRIRSIAEHDSETKLKKETKNLRDFELSLLGAYQRFLKVLDNKVLDCLGIKEMSETEWNNASAKVGLSALRCQCELLRTLPHFNFRQQLLSRVVSYATHPDSAVHSLCCDTLSTLLQEDAQGELSYEVVREAANVLTRCKYAPRCAPLLLPLQHVKLTVHADDSKSVHRRAKAQRKRRRKGAADDAEVGMLEAAATADVTGKQRFQADSLHEICLIYFRIVKQKVGFALLPAALSGLGRITHLVNIDTVQDLMVVLRGILEQHPAAPYDIQLQCVHCALRTLSGPGHVLQLDSDIYLQKLRMLLSDVPVGFQNWGVVVDCVEVCFIKKREERSQVVASFARLLLLLAVHCSHTHGPALYALTHMLLLRYPRVRQDLQALQPRLGQPASCKRAPGHPSAPSAVVDKDSTSSGSGKHGRRQLQERELFDEDGVVEDLAMKALREESIGQEGGPGNLGTCAVSSTWDRYEERLGDGSWVLPLLARHFDRRYAGSLVPALTSIEMLPLPLRESDLRSTSEQQLLSTRLTALLMQAEPSTFKQGQKTGGAGGARGGAGGAGSKPEAGRGSQGNGGARGKGAQQKSAKKRKQ